MRLFLLTAVLPPVIALVGCKTSCQSLCDEMAAFADTCGFSYSDEDLDACYQDNARKLTSDASRDACREYSDDLQTEWTCDDLAIYFDGNSGGGGGGGQ